MNRLLNKIGVCMLAVMVLSCVFILVSLHLQDNTEVYQERHESELETIACEPAEMKLDGSAPLRLRQEYQFKLEDNIENNLSLAFLTVHQYAEVYLGKELVYAQTKSPDQKIGKTTGSNWVLVPLQTEDQGETVTVVITPVYRSTLERVPTFMIGEEGELFRHMLKKDFPNLLLSVLIILLGITFLTIVSYSMIKYRRGKSLLLLGITALIMGIWRITDIPIVFLLLSGKPTMLFYTSVLMLILGTVPFIQIVSRNFLQKYTDIVNYYCLFIILVYSGILLAQITGQADLRELLVLVHGIIGVSAVILIICAVLNRREFTESKKTGPQVILKYVCLLGVVVDVAFYYIKGSSESLIFSLVVFIFYLIYSATMLIARFIEEEQLMYKQKHMLMESEQRLNANKAVTHSTQIKAHFVFNMLNAISAMCKYDPVKADETVVRFSRHLRNTINVMEEDHPVYFGEALEEVENYIELEKIRFGERIQFKEDLQLIDFPFLLLILQPIVENSIRHGISPKIEGGTILLKTWRDEDLIRISVEDDGVGFDVKEELNSNSIGIKNVETRLKYWLDGEIEIQSEAGLGTKVMITIPYKEV